MSNLYNTIENAQINNITDFNSDIIDVLKAKIADRYQEEKRNIAKKVFAFNSNDYIEEKLTRAMAPEEIIHDFVHSDDPKFQGISKKERIKMALGAYYSMHPEKSNK